MGGEKVGKGYEMEEKTIKDGTATFKEGRQAKGRLENGGTGG